MPIPELEETARKPYETIAEYLIYLNDPKQAPVLEKVSNEAISQVFENLVNMMVYELYFEEEMKAKEIVHCLPINWTIIQWRKFA